jgi:hypothetical protein
MSEKRITYLLRFSLSVTFAAVDLACSIILPSAPRSLHHYIEVLLNMKTKNRETHFFNSSPFASLHFPAFPLT